VSSVAEHPVRPAPELPRGSQVLIVGDHANSDEIVATLHDAGIESKTAKSMTEACECVRSGQYQAILSKPLMNDGSWRRLIDVAHHYDLGCEIVLVARDFDHATWAEALNDGAFDVLETLSSQMGAAEVTKRALWAAYLKGAGPNTRAGSPQQAA
jgi:DNA-binding NtrC family response regulator